MAISCITFEIKGDIGRKIAIFKFHTPCIRRFRYGGRRWSRPIGIPFGMEKLEWCGYPMVKTVWWHA